MAINTFEAAKFICQLSDWKVTNLSLNKILYFANMFYLGTKGTPLLDEQFEAWMYGPVLPRLYNKLKMYGAQSIPNRFYGVSDIEDQKIAEFLKNIASRLLILEPWKLVSLTHSKNGAWAKNYDPRFNSVISNKDILEEYKDKVSNEQ